MFPLPELRRLDFYARELAVDPVQHSEDRRTERSEPQRAAREEHGERDAEQRAGKGDLIRRN